MSLWGGSGPLPGPIHQERERRGSRGDPVSGGAPHPVYHTHVAMSPAACVRGGGRAAGVLRRPAAMASRAGDSTAGGVRGGRREGRDVRGGREKRGTRTQAWAEWPGSHWEGQAV